MRRLTASPPRRGARLRLVATLAAGLSLCTAAPLAAQVVITGSVTNAVGVGIPGVDIDLSPSGGGPDLSLSGDLTDAAGAFTITILQGPGFPTYAPGNYLLQLNPPPGFLGETNTVPISVPIGGGLQDLGSFGLVAGWIISGQVVDGNGVGVAGIDIDMRPDGGGGGSALDLTGDTTGALGTFSLTMPAATGVYDIFYTPPAPPVQPGGCTGTFPTANPNCALGVFPLETNGTFIAGNLDLGTIQLQNAHCVTGTLVTPGGQPLAGFDAQAWDAAGAPIALLQDDTDCAGFFRVLVPEGTVDFALRNVALNPPVAYVPVLFEELVVAGPIDLGTVTAYPGFVVTGTVTRTGGAAIANAEIDVLDAVTGALVYESNDRTNALGQFSYLVPAGNWLVEVDPPPALVTTVVPQRVPLTVPGTGPVSAGTIVLPDGFPIGGRCVSAASPTTPVPFVDVEFRLSSTQVPVDALHENAGADGVFSAMLVPGTYDVLLFPPLGSGFADKVVPSVVLSAAVALGDIPLLGIQPPPQPVTGLGCVANGVDVTLTWTNVGSYDGIEVRRDGALIATLPGGATGTTDFGVAAGLRTYTVTPTLGGASATAANCQLLVGSAGVFLRGDVDFSGAISIGDPINLLAYLFSGGSLACLDAGDFNDSGSLDISDPIGLLNYLFAGGAAPPPPFPTPGVDPTADGLSCG